MLPQLNIPQGVQLSEIKPVLDLFRLWLWPLLFIVLGIVIGTFAYLRHDRAPQPTGRLQEIDERLKRLSRRDFTTPPQQPQTPKKERTVITTPAAKPSAPVRRILRALTFTRPREPALPAAPAPARIKPVKPVKLAPLPTLRSMNTKDERTAAGRLRAVDARLKQVDRGEAKESRALPKKTAERQRVKLAPLQITHLPPVKPRWSIRNLFARRETDVPVVQKPAPKPAPKPLKPITVKPVKQVVVKPIAEPRMKHEDADRATATKLQNVNARLKELERKLKRK